jgi:acyl-CoA dehydrogenase
LDFNDANRRIFNESHRIFRDQVRSFIAREVVPNHRSWEADGKVSREIWLRAGEAGLLCPAVPEQYGGAGVDYLFSAIVTEELGRVGATAPGFILHSEMVAPYLTRFGTEEQKRKWLPDFVAGRVIGAVAMSEPSAGSDLKAIRTTAVRHGNGWRINGQKVFISNGQLADFFVVAAKTNAVKQGDISLFIVEAGAPGFTKGRKLEKIGLRGQDTSELFFEDVEVPGDNIIGEIGRGFHQLMNGLVRERLTVAVSCQAKAEHAFECTREYVKQRRLFDKTLIDFQNTRFKLAEVKADLVVGRSFVDDLLSRFMEGTLDSESTAIGKLWLSEMLGRTVDTCLQLHGGWGYMTEFAIGRSYVDARIERIAAGSSEVMKEIISRTL